MNSLPPTLEILTLAGTKFKGSLDFTRLPLAIYRFYAGDDMFSGAIRRGGSQEPSKLSSCFCFGADPIDGRRKVVGQDQHPSMGRCRKPPLVAMGGPGSSKWRDEKTSTHSL